MENDASELMNHTFVGLPFETFIGSSAIMANFELVDDVSHVFPQATQCKDDQYPQPPSI